MYKENIVFLLQKKNALRIQETMFSCATMRPRTRRGCQSCRRRVIILVPHCVSSSCAGSASSSRTRIGSSSSTRRQTCARIASPSCTRGSYSSSFPRRGSFLHKKNIFLRLTRARGVHLTPSQQWKDGPMGYTPGCRSSKSSKRAKLNKIKQN